MLAVIAWLAPLLDRVLAAIVPDPDARRRAVLEALAKLSEGDVEQLRVNAVEAGSGSFFVAGWRPFIGWVCGAALAYQYIVVPLALWIGFVIGHPIPQPPTLDGVLWELMFGMLGMGALRTLEKVKGFSR